VHLTILDLYIFVVVVALRYLGVFTNVNDDKQWDEYCEHNIADTKYTN